MFKAWVALESKLTVIKPVVAEEGILGGPNEQALVMKILASVGLILMTLVVSSSARAEQYLVYVGTYTAEPSSGTPPRVVPGRAVEVSTSQGIYAWRFETTTNTLIPLGLVAETANPAHVWGAPNGKFLYAVNWQENSARVPPGVSAYAIDSNTGALKLLNKQTSAGELPNQVVIDPNGEVAAVVNYKTGNMALMSVHADGALGEPFAVEQSVGKSSGPPGDGPHAHGVVFTKDGRWLFEAELGLDRIYSYKLDADNKKLTPLDPPYVTLPAGSGPRRMQLSPDQHFLYVNRQNDGMVSVFAIDNGRLTPVQEIQTNPSDSQGRGGTAEIQMDHQGHFLYVSLRGSSAIAVYSVDRASGKLTLLEDVPAQGLSPRNITISPDGDFLFVANQASDNVVIFKINHRSGHLDPIGPQMHVSQPGGVALVGSGR
jgi:6-phosphogluconolactonase